MQELAYQGGTIRPYDTHSAPSLRYRIRPGGPETVVLLHGVGSSSETWLELAARLDPAYTLVMPDYRGHGGSSSPEPPYSVGDFVDDLVRLVDELELGAVHLVGFSIGAIFAQAFAIADPDRVVSLVLLNSIAGRTDDEKRRALDRLEVIRATEPAKIAEASVERWFTKGFITEHPELVAAEVAIVSAMRPEPYAASYHLLATTDLVDSVDGITCPVLLITGENDRGSTPRMSREIQSRLRGAELVIVDGRQHYLHIEAAQLIADLINDFVRSHPTPHQ